MAEDTAAQEAHRLDALTMAEAARRLGVPTREIVEAVVQRQIRFIKGSGDRSHPGGRSPGVPGETS